uniref:Odorant receptor n=1 Tax=Campoletis chlorideae TaxID=219166 RepID=A0A346D471_9HYME|nr:odorant receptor [Campoletis chlorideae]
MERTRYFRSSNPFNIFVNFFSGNILPLSEEKAELTFFTILWVIFVWSVKIMTMSSVISGSLYFANLTIRERINKSGPGLSVCIELVIPLVYLNLRREDLRNLIKKYNTILVDSDELKKLVLVTIEPYKKGLKFYIVSCAIAVTTWAATPILTISDNRQYTYSDFSAPAYFPGAPFNANIFLVTVISQTVGSFFITFGKISIDIYINHLIAVLSAEYKYVRTEITKALSQENDQEDEQSIIRSLHKCIGHHCAVIEYSYFFELHFRSAIIFHSFF